MGRLYIEANSKYHNPLGEVKSYDKHMQLAPLLRYITYKMSSDVEDIVVFAEPFLRSDFQILLTRLLADYKCHITLITQGYGLLEHLDFLEGLDNSRISIVFEINNSTNKELVDEVGTLDSNRVFQRLSCSTVNYLVKIPMNKNVKVQEVLKFCRLPKRQAFLIELPFFERKECTKQSLENVYTYSDLGNPILDLFRYALSRPRDRFFLSGVPMCEVKALKLDRFIPANLSLSNPLLPTVGSSVILQSRLVDFDVEYSHTVIKLGNCKDCEYKYTCTGFSRGVMTPTNPPVSCNLVLNFEKEES